MKNLLVTAVLFLATFTVSGQLNNNAKILKESTAIEYKLIKKYAEQRWDEDHEMIVYTINEQADALAEVVSILKSGGDKLIMFKAWNNWEDSSIKVEGKSFVDFEMVLYTYKEQLEAKNSY